MNRQIHQILNHLFQNNFQYYLFLIQNQKIHNFHPLLKLYKVLLLVFLKEFEINRNNIYFHHNHYIHSLKLNLVE